MIRRILLPSCTSSTLLAIAQFFADWHGTCLLYSGGVLEVAEESFLGLFPFESITAFKQQIEVQKGQNKQTFHVQNPWEGLQEHFFNTLVNQESIAFGWLGYSMGSFADQDQYLPYRASTTPDAYWQTCAIVIHFNQKNQTAFVQINQAAFDYIDDCMKEWVEKLSTLEGWIEFLQKLPRNHLVVESRESIKINVDDLQRRSLYIENVLQAQEWIRAGEIYQVNLSQQFDFQSQRHPFSVFSQICQSNPAPFAAYFRYQSTSLVCTSPERFLRKKNLDLETRPIKGTMRRGNTKDEDDQLKHQLLTSIKEKAELLMITDLMRNDLGKISEVGSVKVKELWRCEAYQNVFHLLSIIHSKVKADLAPLQIVRACFPGGSITGCPKLKAIEAIDVLEKRPRGIYTGSIGYFTGRGDFDLNIAIRTLVVEKNLFSLQLGGGIVIDSDPDLEYRETLIKGHSFFETLKTEKLYV